MIPADVECVNGMDHAGRPFGGYAEGNGVKIRWQQGPLAVDGERREPNGAFVETVIEIAKQRLEFYQRSPFNCEENTRAILHLEAAIDVLNSRTARRAAEGTEGTWKVEP